MRKNCAAQPPARASNATVRAATAATTAPPRCVNNLANFTDVSLSQR